MSPPADNASSLTGVKLTDVSHAVLSTICEQCAGWQRMKLLAADVVQVPGRAT